MVSGFQHIILAFVEGLGLAASPCILPVLPFILAASSHTSKWRPFLIITGFIVSFTFLSLVSRQLLSLFNLQQSTIQIGAYSLLLLFGIVMLVPFLEKYFAAITAGFANKAQNESMAQRTNSIWGALIIGTLIGVVWTPCAGPIMAAALLQVVLAESWFEAGTTILAFTTGAAIPMLLVALFSHALTSYIKALARHAVIIRRVMGVVIIGFAIMGLSGFNIGEWVAVHVS